MNFFIIWYLIGLISFYLGCYIGGRLTITDMAVSFIIATGGLVTSLLVFFYIVDVYGHKTLWKRKK